MGDRGSIPHFICENVNWRMAMMLEGINGSLNLTFINYSE